MAQVLLIGDEKDRTQEVKSLLAQDGHAVALVKDVDRWRDEERSTPPEIVVAAVATPDRVLSVPMGGSRGFAPPILFVHRESDEAHEPRLEERMVDRIASPFAAEEFLGRIDALIRVRRIVMRQTPGSRRDAGEAAAGGTWYSALSSLFRSRWPRRVKPQAPYLEVATALADWSDRRDGFDPGHAERVAHLSALIADEFGLSDGETAVLLRAAMLHDIGKVALPVELLRREGPLEERQVKLLRTHAERGATILRALDNDDVVADTILYHHENVDGSGYCGRKGDAIPRAARILAVAEGFDAMTTSRVRKRLSADAALDLMRGSRGAQWDAPCVDALVDALRPRPNSIALS